MRCPVCVEKEMRSALYPGGSFTTCMAGSPGHYDEAGDWVEGYDPNITTTSYGCTNGHTFVEKSRMGKVIETVVTHREEAKRPSDRPPEAGFTITSGNAGSISLGGSVNTLAAQPTKGENDG
jgi:hypothetical protein